MHLRRALPGLAAPALVLLGALALAGCPADQGDTGAPSLTLTANPTSVVADGAEQVVITVSGVDGEGKALAGTVVLTTTAGAFDGGKKSYSGTLQGGSLQATLTTCNSHEDATCTGNARVTAGFGTATASTTVVFEPYCPGGPGPETLCGDGEDNDCNGKTDCEDPACAGQACNAFGSTCDETGACVCAHDGPEGAAVGECYDGVDDDCDGLTDGDDEDCKDKPCDDHGDVWSQNQDGSPLCTCVATQTTESTCGDGLDNDCDGKVDCADPDCEGTTCQDASKAPNDQGLTCVPFSDGTGACTCAADALGNGQEASCSNGIDDDCDGLTDCADTTNCDNQPCGAYGQICNAAGACACPHTQEVCSPDASGVYPDDDCDGLRGCEDPDCNGKLCDAHGETCSSGLCSCPGGSREDTCGDNKDNDCDGLTDCADPDCDLLSCGNGRICDASSSSCVTDPGTNRVDLVADRYQVPADATAEVVLTATVQNNSGPIGSYAVDFSVAGGGLVEASGGRTFTTTTDVSGHAVVHWRTGPDPSPALAATATIVSAPATGAQVSKSISEQIIGLESIEVQSIENTTMGLQDSGWQESSLITYVLKGTDGQHFGLAMPDGADVTFALDTLAGGLMLSRASDASVGSRVSTTAVAGTQVVSFTVTATATVGLGTDSVVAGPINIVGAKPSYGGFTLSCAKKNVNGLGTFMQDSFPTSTTVSASVACSATLNDRFGNPIQRPDIRVKFFSEGGTMQSDKPIQNGVSQTTYLTYGDLPADVQPMSGEPSWVQTVNLQDGGTVTLTRNPRDGLATIIAFISGEEQFTDLNGNGAYDPGEPFVDLSEPYIDENDNSIRDPNEVFWDVDGDGTFDGPNGQWDSNTLIWTQTRLLLTGCQYLLPSGTGYLDTFPGGPGRTDYIADGATASVPFRITDINMNVLSPGTKITLSKVSGPPNKVNVEIEASGTSYSVPDGWGMGWAVQTDESVSPYVVRSIIVPPTNALFGVQLGVRVTDSAPNDQNVDTPEAFTIRTTAGPCNPLEAFETSGAND